LRIPMMLSRSGPKYSSAGANFARCPELRVGEVVWAATGAFAARTRDAARAATVAERENLISWFSTTSEINSAAGARSEIGRAARENTNTPIRVRCDRRRLRTEAQRTGQCAETSEPGDGAGANANARSRRRVPGRSASGSNSDAVRAATKSPRRFPSPR